MKYIKLTFCLALLVLSTFSVFVSVGKALEMATVYVDPAAVIGLSIGDNFTINVNVASVTFLGGWEFQLFYSPQVLNATEVIEGAFLKSVANTFFLVPGFDDHYNSTHGRVYVACATLPVTGADGSGTLASIVFHIVGAGYTVLALPAVTTKLLDATPGRPQDIPHAVANGVVSVVGADIAITNIHSSKTIASINTVVIINVTAANLGNFSGSFQATLYYDSTEVGTQTVTDLAPSTNLILTFMWNTTSIPKGNYTISAYAPPITGESNIENNRLTDGWIKVSMPGDVNGDGRVNILDISAVAKAFGSKPGDPSWNPNADVDNNETVNIIDISKVAKEFGKVDP
jgi:hypothetical protein